MIIQDNPIAQAINTVTGIPFEELEELYQKYGSDKEQFGTELDKFLTSKGFDPTRVAMKAMGFFFLSTLKQ